MKAARLEEGVLHIRDLPVPEPGPEEALVRIHAAGVAVRSGRSYGLSSFLRVSVGTAETMERVAVALAAHGGDHAAR